MYIPKALGASIMSIFVVTFLCYAQPAFAANSFADVGAEVQTWQQEKPLPISSDEELQEEQPENAINNSAAQGNWLTQGEFTIIDKKNGKLAHITVPVGGSQHFESLIINLHSCWQEKLKRYRRANKALLEVFNFHNNVVAEQKFYGWMLSNNPEASYLPHERYDIMLKNCIE